MTDPQFHAPFMQGCYLQDTCPYMLSSDMSDAWYAGHWCRMNGVQPIFIHKSRGYKWIVNGLYTLDFKDDSRNPIVTRKG